jgi:hypothetical protein
LLAAWLAHGCSALQYGHFAYITLWFAIILTLLCMALAISATRLLLQRSLSHLESTANTIHLLAVFVYMLPKLFFDMAFQWLLDNVLSFSAVCL